MRSDQKLMELFYREILFFSGLLINVDFRCDAGYEPVRQGVTQICGVHTISGVLKTLKLTLIAVCVSIM